jgi:hypothetical protein
MGPENTEKSRTRAAEKEARGSYVRWQKVTGNQLGSTVKLVLTLTTGSLAFGADLLFKRNAGAPVCWYVASITILILAAAAGLAVNATRLMDFRWTTRAARMRQLRAGLRPVEQFSPPKWLEKLDCDKLFKSPDSPDPKKSVLSNLKSKLKECNSNGENASLPQQPPESPDEQTWRTIGRYCKERYEWWGQLTWWLLIAQFVLFGVGIALLAIGVMCHPLGGSSDEKKKTAETVRPVKQDESHVSDNPSSSQGSPATTPYTVLRGDTLGRIAGISYRDSTRWVDIYEYNKNVIGKNPNSLQPGQILEIPH